MIRLNTMHGSPQSCKSAVPSTPYSASGSSRWEGERGDEGTKTQEKPTINSKRNRNAATWLHAPMIGYHGLRRNTASLETPCCTPCHGGEPRFNSGRSDIQPGSTRVMPESKEGRGADGPWMAKTERGFKKTKALLYLRLDTHVSD